MKKLIALLLACVMVLGLAACAPANNGETTNANNDTTAPAGNDDTTASTEAQDITLTVWGPQAELGENNDGWLPTWCEKFNEAHPEWNITFKYEVCGEGDAGNKVTGDPAAAGDIYFFANDQLGSLIQANAIARLGGDVLAQVQADNTPEMVATVSVGDAVYGIPFTTNTWFMFYDKSVFTEEDVKSLDVMLEKGKVSFPLTTGWYFGSFYAANGGTLYEDGTNLEAGINFGGENGVAVTNYLINLSKNANFINDADGAGMAGLRDGSCSAIFSGTWDTNNVKEALGENWAACPAPSITIDGELKQLAPFGGSKAIAVNPNCANPQAAAALAAFLATPEAQLAHFEFNGTAPVSSTLLTENAEIAADMGIAAAVETVGKYAIIQPSFAEFNNTYWGQAEAMAKAIVSGDVNADNAAEKTEAFNTALNNGGL